MQTRSLIPRAALPLVLLFASLPPCLSCAKKVEGRTLAEWNALLDKGSPEQQIEAAKAIAQFGPKAKSSIPILFKRNAHERGYDVTQHFQRALIEIGPEVDRFLLEMLEDPDEQNRYRAASAITDIGLRSIDSAGAIVAALETCVGDESKHVRKAALRALGFFGPWAQPCIPTIVSAMGDPDGDIRLAAVGAIRDMVSQATGDMKDRAAGAIPVLLRMIDDDYVAEHRVADNPIRDWAILTLAEFGPRAAPAVPRLKQVLFESGPYSEECRIEAARALYLIEKPDEAYKNVVVQGVFDGDPGVRATAIARLSDLGEIDDLVLDQILDAFLGERDMAAIGAQLFLERYLAQHPDKTARLRERLKGCDKETAANLESWLARLELQAQQR
jgi:HEAT repeat protein